MTELINKNKKYLALLAKQYPTIQSVCTEIINLRAVLNLPKGTEHFLSDLHGEYEAFTHILNNCSGVIREKADEIFGEILSDNERGELCTLIYYPEQKFEQVKTKIPSNELSVWYEKTLLQLIEITKVIASKYTRAKVREAMPSDYAYIIDELLHADYKVANQVLYYEKIMESILSTGDADNFIIELAALIKRLAVDKMHIVGDIFDRGPRPDLIMDMLLNYHSVDFQWGNHDVLWMGAAAGSKGCAAAVLVNSAAYGNLKVLEQGYGINLRSLALFADKTYRESPCFAVKAVPGKETDEDDAVLAGKMYKALAIIMFKLSGQIYHRNPEYGMNNRTLLDKINYSKGTICINGIDYPLKDTALPTIDPKNPFELSNEEHVIINELIDCFKNSERLQRHVAFLYANGGMYQVYNQNLMYHGCIPMNEDGSFTKVNFCGKEVSGRALMDRADEIARTAYFGSGRDKEQAEDAMWYLWCGGNSPIFGRSCMTTFERLFIADKNTWTEVKNPYYSHIQNEQACLLILSEFNLNEEISHIVNGHVPVKASSGENPVKGGGRLIVIDGGFCRAYHSQTGIAGYTLIYNSWGMRLSAHTPFESTQKAVEENIDIHSVSEIFEKLDKRLLVLDTDAGQEISEQIFDLSLLLAAYRAGILSAK